MKMAPGFNTICLTVSCVLILQVVPNIGQIGFNGVPCRGQCGTGTFCSSADDYCKCIPGLIQRTENNGSFTCTTDVDECELGIFDCPSDSKCVNSHGGYHCTCKDGLYKTVNGYCQPDIDECSLGVASCPENTNCKNTLGYYTCVCSRGFIRAENGTCIEEYGGSLAWYWWVGIVFITMVGIVLIVAILRCVCNRFEDDVSSTGELPGDRLTEIYTDKDIISSIKEDTVTKELISSPDTDNASSDDDNIEGPTLKTCPSGTGQYSKKDMDKGALTVDSSLLSNSLRSIHSSH